MSATDLTTIYPIKDEMGQVQSVGIICRDITQQKNAEQELRRLLAETERSKRMLLGLSQAAQAVQRARSPEEVYQAIGKQVSGLGYNVTVFWMSEDRTSMRIHHLTLDSAVVRTAEKLTGLSAQDFSYPLKPGSFYDRLMNEGKPVFDDPAAGAIADALPRALRPLTGRLADTLNIGQAIYVPLWIHGRPEGLLTVMGRDLTEADVPAITAFGNQAAIALENTLSAEELRKRNQEMAVLNAVTRAASQSLDLQEVLESALDETRQSAGCRGRAGLSVG